MASSPKDWLHGCVPHRSEIPQRHAMPTSDQTLSVPANWSHPHTKPRGQHRTSTASSNSTKSAKSLYSASTLSTEQQPSAEPAQRAVVIEQPITQTTNAVSGQDKMDNGQRERDIGASTRSKRRIPPDAATQTQSKRQLRSTRSKAERLADVTSAADPGQA